MNFQPDIAGDALLIDGTETVTLHADRVVVVEGAKRGTLSLGEIEFRQVGLESRDLAWQLPGGNLADVEPRPGDAIEDAAGAFWTVQSAVQSPLTRVWRLVTRRQV
jgi:hypothetical protein